MKKFLLISMSAGILAMAAFLSSCDGDEDSFDAPTLSLSQTEITASPGEEVTVDIDASTDGGFKDLVVKKMWDDATQDEETFTTLPANYSYTVTEEDAEHVLKLNFTVTDNQGKTASKDLVITVELTPTQILLKYDWKLTEEIRKKTNENDIADAYTDDVYRFNADGTYQKSIGEKNDGFNDLVHNYCFYDLNENTNENTMRLLMSSYDGWNLVDKTDTLTIVLLDDTEMHADVTYYDLDQLDPTYDPVEEYQKRFVAVAKGSNFDPYLAGSEDDETGPVDHCTEVVFEND
jgi:hypothetical protein